MLKPRIIPSLLIHKGNLVKTVNFKDPKYIGDPLNAVKIFNEKEVDEILISDIDATVNNQSPNFRLLQQIAIECRMPICYSGGVNTVEVFERLIGLGIEKVGIGAAAVKNPNLIGSAASRVGSQSVVVIMDFKKIDSNYYVFTHNGKINSKLDPINFSKIAQEEGAGEIVLNSIDNDGAMLGYDTEIFESVRKATQLPITLLGGASSYEYLKYIASRYGLLGMAAGSLFVFKGKFKAVLIQYPDASQKSYIC